MTDPVRLNSEDFRAIYEQGFRTWSAFYAATVEQTGLPSSYLSIHDAFRQHGSFPHDLQLNHIKYAAHSQVYATGCVNWGSTQADCESALPQFQQQDQIPIASRNPTLLSTVLTAEPAIRWASWFARGDQNRLAVLILAWPYVLSARWAEVMPEGASLFYTSSMADAYDARTPFTPLPEHPKPEVDIRYAGPDETRWWAAVLAPGQGWQATLSLGQDTFLAPWSIRLQPGYPFLLATTSVFQTDSAAAPSCAKALSFLDNFCLHQNTADQSQAALAAVLLFPSMGTGKGLQLPALAASHLAGQTASTPSMPRQQCPSTNSNSRHSWTDHVDDLDRLITLSCRSKGIRPMLLSSFYNPGIECNAVTPWLRGSLAAIDAAVAQGDPLALGRMLMDRQPKLAALWLGATVLGLQQTLLRDVGFGMIPIDLQSAAWSGTIQSFLQEPISDPLAADGYVSRAGQCRLLFLSRSGSHNRVPVCQWRPFGRIPLEHTDLEVRAHELCKNHSLQCRGFTWDCVGGTMRYQPSDGDDPAFPLADHELPPSSIPVDHGSPDPEKDFMSENATRSIFGWLRVDGYALGERELWEHEWLEGADTDDEEEGKSDDISGKTRKLSANVEVWLPQVSHEAQGEGPLNERPLHKRVNKHRSDRHRVQANKIIHRLPLNPELVGANAAADFPTKGVTLTSTWNEKLVFADGISDEL
ncbi:hypothetical protein B0T14DRAFT_541019 [Immersiella caudata]|uniref:Uncharacterized protein n=1 Tax=Immersiella caudata TaxID=314043 RepID=A0AA39TG42_9PEZI|nr:hypothetical protein B0T14DRAFT_541019 [Immersiella caudata]